jgi:hypothetical protein
MPALQSAAKGGTQQRRPQEHAGEDFADHPRLTDPDEQEADQLGHR